MTNVRIEFNSEGFRQILTSEGCHELVQGITESIADRANANAGLESFRASTQLGGYGGGRWIGFATATDKAAMVAEAEDKALTRAITS